MSCHPKQREGSEDILFMHSDFLGKPSTTRLHFVQNDKLIGGNHYDRFKCESPCHSLHECLNPLNIKTPQ